MDDDEILNIWKKLDRNGDGSITYDELIDEFAALNTELLLKRLRSTMKNSNIDIPHLFRKFCKRDPDCEIMHLPEFDKMTRYLIRVKLIKQEIFHLSSHFDKGNKSYITRDDFRFALKTEYMPQESLRFSIYDIIKPMATKAKKFNANLGTIFEKYDKNKDATLSVEELKAGLERH